MVVSFFFLSFFFSFSILLHSSFLFFFFYMFFLHVFFFIIITHSLPLPGSIYIYCANGFYPRTAPVLKACSWAVGAFVFGSFFMHEYCQRKRLLEIRGLKMAAEMIDQKRAERLEQMRIARQKAREEVKEKS